MLFSRKFFWLLFLKVAKMLYPRDARKIYSIFFFERYCKCVYRAKRRKCLSVFKGTVNAFIWKMPLMLKNFFQLFFERNCKCFYHFEMSVTLRSSSASFTTYFIQTFLSNTDLQLVLVRGHKPTRPCVRPTRPLGQKTVLLGLTQLLL